MVEVKLSENCTLKLYGSIKELPIYLSKKMGAYLLQDAGIGNDIEAIDNHLGKLMNMLSLGKTDDALEEAKNMRYNMFMALTGMNYKALSLLCLVHSINGQPWEDHTEVGLQRLLTVIEQHPVGALERELESIKKKLIPNAASIFQDSLVMT